MERAAWLQQMRGQMEDLYDHLSPQYWVELGLYANETHREFLQKLLDRVPPQSTLLSAACGAGRYDGLLLDAGHSVVGTDQSAGMLARARERYPDARYEKMGLQEMRFHQAFEGATCIDAMEHICPEDWPGVLRGFWEALKPGGVLYFTVEVADARELEDAFEQAKSRGLPVVYGEQVSDHDLASGETAGKTIYHYYPSPDRVRAWLEEARFELEAEGTGNGYQHFVVRKE